MAPAGVFCDAQALQGHQPHQQPAETAKCASDSTLRRWRRKQAAGRKQAADRKKASAALQRGSPKYGGVVDGLLADLDADGKAREAAMRKIQGSVLKMSLDQAECHVVQHALKVGTRADFATIIEGLRGHVWKAIDSLHGNFVIEKVIEQLPEDGADFVIKELPRGSIVAKHQQGCRILRKLVEHHSTSAALAAWLEREVLVHADELARHQFANHVIEAILERVPEHRARIAAAIKGSVLDLARHRSGSRIVEAALRHCSSEDRLALASLILVNGVVFSARGGGQALAEDRIGAFVVRALLRLPDQGPREECRQQVWAGAALLQQTKEGLKLLKDAGFLPAAAATAA